MYLEKQDPDVFAALKHEDKRQEESLEMIASENFVSQAVLEAYHKSTNIQTFSQPQITQLREK
jgi:glycine hydroxymethyltransferase